MQLPNSNVSIRNLKSAVKLVTHEAEEEPQNEQRSINSLPDFNFHGPPVIQDIIFSFWFLLIIKFHLFSAATCHGEWGG